MPKRFLGCLLNVISQFWICKIQALCKFSLNPNIQLFKYAKIISIGQGVWPQSTKVMDGQTDGIGIAQRTNHKLLSQKSTAIYVISVWNLFWYRFNSCTLLVCICSSLFPHVYSTRVLRLRSLLVEYVSSFPCRKIFRCRYNRPNFCETCVTICKF